MKARVLHLVLICVASLLVLACGEVDDEVSEDDVSALSSPAKYENDEGCLVTVEPHPGQTLVMVDKGAARADFGYRPDLTSGDITAFCSPAAVKDEGNLVTISCDEQNGDGVPTRGRATMELTGGLVSATTGGLTAVEVVAERKGWLFWSTDTEISCKNLRLRE